ncbi:MAG: CheR family methyltransferase [Desulfobacterales bacterium]|nr:CheR family methyltransferase [Desulfobacterales bacterium]
MTTTPAASFSDLVEQYLGRRLPPAMAEVIALPQMPIDAQALIRRMLALMQRARYPVTDFNFFLIQMLATMVPGVLPCSWDGRIPPLTVPGRHRKLDAYVAAQDWPTTAIPPVFVDLGCGFPPVTTVDTAGMLPDWKVYGVDRFFAEYVVYDSKGHYACFDSGGRYHYFQPRMSPEGMAMYADPEATQAHFETLFEELLPLLPNTAGDASTTVTRNAHQLVRHQISEFETENLVFVQAEIDTLELPPARVVRCMNVLVYFSPPVRKKMLRRIAALLGEGGLLIAGTSGFGIDARYSVYRKTGGALVPDEFAFGIENLRSLGIMPYFTICEGDNEATLLAQLMGAIRADPSYWPALSNRVDKLLAQAGISQRGPDGFLQPPPEETPRSEIRRKIEALWRQIIKERFLAGALETLARAGYTAWENDAGDIAIRPPADFSP